MSFRIVSRADNVTQTTLSGDALEFTSEFQAEQHRRDFFPAATFRVVPASQAKPTKNECIDRAARAYNDVMREISEQAQPLARPA